MRLHRIFLHALFQMLVFAGAVHAQIAVEQPVGTGLTSGASTRDFGSAVIGTPGSALTFTVRNTGPGTLSGLAASVVGAAQLDYTVNAAGLPTSLAAGTSGTFTVSFRPWQSGARAAALHIASSDPGSPFNVALTGTGLTQPGPEQSVVTAPPRLVKTGNAPFFLRSGATSGLPLSYAVLTGPATISSDGLVTLTGQIGAVTLNVSQTGGDGYQPAEAYPTFQVTEAGQEFVKVVGGRFYHLAAGIRADGTLWAWGDNSRGQLGDGTTTQPLSPVKIGTSPWISVDYGTHHTAGVKSDGTLWAWGEGITTSPVRVGTAANWTAVACGTGHTVVLKSDGTLWAWGSNGYGQLGDGTTTGRSSPVRIGTASNWVAATASNYHTTALKADGTLWAWGTNAKGVMGTGGNSTSPVQVGTSRNWVAVACGFQHTVAVKADGTLWAWGANRFGELGDGTTIQRDFPVRIGSADDWAKVACGGDDIVGAAAHTVAVKKDGTLWAWGWNNVGQLGDGSATIRTSPVQVGSADDWTQPACGQMHSMALRSDGTLWTWGGNGYNQLGYGTASLSPDAVLLGTHGGCIAAACGPDVTLAVRRDGTLWGWGRNQRGQLGDGTSESRFTPKQIGTDNNWNTLACGTSHTVAVKSDGTLWAWGGNSSYALGDGTLTDRPSPVQIGSAANWKTVACGDSHSAAIKRDGTLWVWGSDAYGQLGDGSGITTRTRPFQIDVATNWVSVACGIQHTMAIKSDGTLWAWGGNGAGQLGVGTTTQHHSPVQVGTATNWAMVACGAYYTEAVKSDGTLWAWGGTSVAQLGNGTTHQTSPVQIGMENNWTSVACSGMWSNSHTMALKRDGTLWAWGDNVKGQLGDGTTTTSNSPVQVGTSNAWGGLPIGLGHVFSAALTMDGTLWTCGDHYYGQLGRINQRIPNRIWPERAAQTISLPALPSLSVGQPVALSAVPGSQLPTAYGLAGPATLSLGMITPTAAGTIDVIAWQPGDTAWVGTAPVRQTQSLTTQPAAVTAIATGVSATAATLNGTVNPGGLPTRVQFEYGPTTAYGTTVDVTFSPNNGTTAQAVSTIITGLAPGITYYRITATNSLGTATGTNHYFVSSGPGIAVEQPTGTGLVSGSNVLDFGPTQIGETGSMLTFTVRNIGSEPLSSLAMSVDGTAALDYTVQAAGLPTSIAPGDSGTFTVVFRAWQGGVRPAVLHIASNAPLHNPFNIALTGMGLTLPGPGQSIVTATVPSTVRTGSPPFNLLAAATSGLPLTYAVLTGPAAISNSGLVTATGATGPVTVKISQSGGSGYTPAVTYATFHVIAPGQMFVKLATATLAHRSAAIRADGTLWAWGDNSSSRLGDGTAITPTAPVQIGTASNWAEIACGPGHTIAVRTDGTLWGWGYNGNGQLGSSLNDTHPSPVQIGTARNWAKVAACSTCTLAIKNDGTLWSWGLGIYGELGQGRPSNSSPTQVGSATNWVSVTCGDTHVMALQDNGTLWGWGYNAYGQLGDGSTTNRNSPVQIGTAANWASVACSQYHTVAVKTDGTLWAWGNGYASSPVQVGSSSNWTSVACGSAHTVVVRSDGTLWAWGTNDYGQLGDATITNRVSPVLVSAASNWTSVACGAGHTVALQRDGTIWSWGRNDYSQLGDGTRTQRFRPVPAGAESRWVEAASGHSHMVAVKSDGTLWAWGRNAIGQLGDGTTTMRPSPVQVGSASNWVAAAGGDFHTLARKSDDTLWAWGNNDYGQLGDGTTTSRSSPVQVGSASNWRTVSCGWNSTVAIKADGTLWAWGLGFSSSGPLQIGSGTNWAAVACGTSHVAAIQIDGTLWAWGQNDNGQVGNGTTNFVPSPIQIGTATDWAAVACGNAHTMATKRDGTLWGWGWNSNGQVGDGTMGNRTSPVRIGFANDWAAVACSAFHTMALKSNGTLWAWGLNGYGQLGDGTTTQRISPVQIGSSTAWGKLPLRLGHQFSAVLSFDGTMWTCGDRTSGGLASIGPGVPSRISPVVVPQALNFPALPPLFVGMPVTLSAAADSLLPVTYGVAGPATLNGNILTPTAAGTVQIIAWQPGDAAWATTEPRRVSQNTIIPAAPILSLPANITVEATSPAGAGVTYTATAIDAGSGVATSSFLPASGSVFPIGTTTVNASATDTVGNTSTGSFTVTVRDTIAPVLSLPANITVEATSPAGAGVTYTATAIDAGSGVATSSFLPASGSVFAIGTTTVNASATDVAGNTATGSFTVTVRDTTAPVFTTCPPSRSIRAAKNETSIALGNLISEAVAVDTVGVTGITQNPAAGTALEAGDHTVGLTATDAAGNSATCNVVVTVVLGNRTPVAEDDYAFVTSGSITIDVLDNDTDGDNQPLTITAVTPPTGGGTATIQGGKIVFTTSGTVTTPRTFSYTVTDGEDTATATVTVFRNPPIGYTYVGHLFDTDGTTIRGLMQFMIAKASGTFSGKIFIGGKNHSLKGNLVGQSPTVVIAGATQTFAGIPVIISAGPLDGSGEPQLAFSVPGEVPGTKWSGLAERSPYFKLRNGQQNLFPSTGKYTVIFEDSAGQPEAAVAGGAAVKLKSPALALFTGKHANGKGLSTATYLLSGGRALFYSGTQKGTEFQSLAGTLVLGGFTDRDIGGTVLWTVPPGFDGKIPGGLLREYDVVGSRYSSSLKWFSPPSEMLDYNPSGIATFSFSLPSSGRVVDEVRAIGPIQRITGPPLSGWFRPAAGYFSGTYSDATTPNANFQGWVLQHPAQNRGKGYVLDTDRLGSVSLTPAP